MKKLLEIIVMDARDAVAAQQGGADHLEVVRDLQVGGLTPDADTLKAIRAAADIPLNVMLRPHARDFIYTADEVESILRDAEQLIRLGANGIVFGAITPDGQADIALFRRVTDVCRGFKPDVVMTFHRAIEEVRDPEAVLESLLGIADRVLCSGLTAQTGKDDRSLLREWVRRYGMDIHFACGSGVTLENLRDIARATCAPEFHVGTGAQTGGVVDLSKVAELVAIIGVLPDN